MIDLSKYEEIIIWGAAFPPSEVGECATSHGHAMEKLVDLLKREDGWDKVIAVVDSNQKIHGRKRFGIEVCSPKLILEHADALVVLNTISISAIKRAMNNMGVDNDCAVIPYYFYHGTLDYPYRNEVAKKNAENYSGEINDLYEVKDEQTKRYLDIILSMRLSGVDKLYDISYYKGTGEGVAYFCDTRLSPKGDVTYIDVGAFDGDSLLPVEKYYGDRLKKYIGFEPDTNSMKKLKKYIKENNLAGKSYLLQYALGESDKQIRFSVSGSTSQESEKGEVILEQRKFDGLPDMDIIGDAMVKMDIEGAELGALEGMQNFILEKKPYLAICIYHKECDLYDIANYIKNLDNGYSLYIRGGWHLECWAIPERHFK